MGHKPAANKKTASKQNDSAIRSSIRATIDRRTNAKGIIEFPCVPALLDWYMDRLARQWANLGRTASQSEMDELRAIVKQGLERGYQASSYSLFSIEYETRAAPQHIAYTTVVRPATLDHHYTHWTETKTGPLFGQAADAKLMDIAATLGLPESVPALDLGAGTGRNAIALARRGHPTTAVEMVPALSEEMQKAANRVGVSIDIVESDILSLTLPLRQEYFKLALMSEVASHFRGLEQLRTAFGNLAKVMAPGGVVLFNAFLANSGYHPDELARQVAEIAWCTLFTRAEIASVAEEFPFEQVSDESAYEYERDHLPEGAWPPTAWYEGWAQGRNIFSLPESVKPPAELRWLVFRRRG
jgi:SAM-dependent methyltransferase